jgi:hypothetical protein
MEPITIKANLPSAHNISTYIHNSFITLLDDLKSEILVDSLGFFLFFVSNPYSLLQTHINFPRFLSIFPDFLE